MGKTREESLCAVEPIPDEEEKKTECEGLCPPSVALHPFFFSAELLSFSLSFPGDRGERESSMPPRRWRSAPRLLPKLSLVAALVVSYSCAHPQGHAKQGQHSRPAPASAARAALFSRSPSSPSPSSAPDPPAPDLPSVSASGYVPNGGADRGGGRLFFTYYEKNNSSAGSNGDEPIFLWLEGGPGCASSFGNFYINGPARALASRDESAGRRRATGKLRTNPHAWNALGGLLFIDQPVGTGFSVPGGAGRAMIPRTEVEVAADLYFGLCELFGPGGPLEALAPRPLFVAGESYAGKFVPSIAHYILQAEAEAGGGGSGRRRRGAATAGQRLRVRRELRRERDASSGAMLPLRPPPFYLAGIAVVRVVSEFSGVFSGERERERTPTRKGEKKRGKNSLRKKKKLKIRGTASSTPAPRSSPTPLPCTTEASSTRPSARGPWPRRCRSRRSSARLPFPRHTPPAPACWSASRSSPAWGRCSMPGGTRTTTQDTPWTST